MLGNHYNSFCRIGIFYDGSYFAYAQKYFYHQRDFGWLEFRPFHSLIETCVRAKEQNHSSYKVVYAAWFQRRFSVTQSNDHHLRFDRNLDHDLLHAGIEPKYLPTSTSGSEKGADVALALDALQLGLDGKIDVAVLITGDADFVPLVRALMKQGVRVMAAYFKHHEGEYKSYIDDRLRTACNYEVNIDELETDKEFKGAFKACFGKRIKEIPRIEKLRTDA